MKLIFFFFFMEPRLLSLWNNFVNEFHSPSSCARHFNTLLRSFPRELLCMDHTGWPRKNATLTINNFKKPRDRMKTLCALLRMKFFSQQDDTKNVNFGEGVLIIWPFFVVEAMSFWRFALLSQKSQFTYRKFSIVWLPREQCLLSLCKAKPAWVTRNIHYVTLQHFHFENDIASKKWL